MQQQRLSNDGVGPSRAAELFWLDLMLTGDALHAERAMFGALSCEDDLSEPGSQDRRVAPRSFVDQALRSVWSDLVSSIGRITLVTGEGCGELPIATLQDLNSDRLQQAVLQIDTFPRCVLVLRLFQKMSIAEINSFLKVNVQLLQQALSFGLVELTRNLASGSTAERLLANAAMSTR